MVACCTIYSININKYSNVIVKWLSKGLNNELETSCNKITEFKSTFSLLYLFIL